MAVERLYELYRKHPQVITDSRKAMPGSIFFALKGERFDGNRFATEALEKGAAAAVVSDPEIVDDGRYVLVEDTLRALQDLARHHRRHIKVPVIALTGTNGKTTTKELIVSVLSRKYRVTGTKGNLNNHIGVPLTLLSATDDTEILVVEMGANHPGEIGFLCDIADPTHGLITNVGRAHLEGFGSFEKVVETKSELYKYLQKKGGKVYYRKEDPVLAPHAEKVRRRLSYGVKGSGADILFEEPQPAVNVIFRWYSPEGPMLVRSSLYGKYNFENMMAAIAIGTDLGVAPEKIIRAVENYVPQNMRSQVVRTSRQNTVVLDAYNANPTSMRVAIENFLSLEGEKKMLVLGDMYELGEYAGEEHEKIVNLLLKNRERFREGILIGPAFYQVCGENDLRAFRERDEAAAYLKKVSWSGAYVLVKGSRGMEMETFMDYL